MGVEMERVGVLGRMVNEGGGRLRRTLVAYTNPATATAALGGAEIQRELPANHSPEQPSKFEICQSSNGCWPELPVLPPHPYHGAPNRQRPVRSLQPSKSPAPGATREHREGRGTYT